MYKALIDNLFVEVWYNPSNNCTEKVRNFKKCAGSNQIMNMTENRALDQSDIILFKKEFAEIKDEKGPSLWPPFIEKLRKS